MAMTDPISDLLTRIRNAQMRGLDSTIVIGSKMADNILSVLREEGFIDSYENVERTEPGRRIKVALKYWRGSPVVKEIKRISKPGRRVYSSVSSLSAVKNGLGVAIISTPVGVITDHKARELNVGGEVLCTVF